MAVLMAMAAGASAVRGTSGFAVGRGRAADSLDALGGSPLPGHDLAQRAGGLRLLCRCIRRAIFEAASAPAGLGRCASSASAASAPGSPRSWPPRIGAPAPVTVRPVGDPFRREIRVADDSRAELLDGSAPHFAIVDEGPGLSGSSFGAVADLARGAEASRRERIHFFPSHGNDLGPDGRATRTGRAGRRRSRHVVDFDELVLARPTPAHRLESWVADLVGAAEAPLRGHLGRSMAGASLLDGGRVAALPCPAGAPQVPAPAPAGTWLLKFVGLGGEGAAQAATSRRDAPRRRASAPEPAGYRHGFLVERWIDDGAASIRRSRDRAALVEALGGYIGFRAPSLSGGAAIGARPSPQLVAMARHNAATGDWVRQAPAYAIELGRRLCPASSAACGELRTDNRLHAWEWLRAGRRRSSSRPMRSTTMPRTIWSAARMPPGISPARASSSISPRARRRASARRVARRRRERRSAATCWPSTCLLRGLPARLLGARRGVPRGLSSRGDAHESGGRKLRRESSRTSCGPDPSPAHSRSRISAIALMRLRA